MNIVVSKARAMQIRWIAWVLTLLYWVYFGLVLAHFVERPSRGVKVEVLVALACVSSLQGYGLWVSQKWQKAERASATV